MPEETKSTLKQEPEADLVSWIAPARPFKRRDRKFYTTIIAIAALCGLILFLIEGFLPVILIISIVFLFYILSTVEPENIEYKITNRGIKVGINRTDWELLGRFWFTNRFDTELLIVETAAFPGRLELVIKPEIKAEIEKNVGKYLTQEEIPASSLDKAANWFSERLPGLK